MPARRPAKLIPRGLDLDLGNPSAGVASIVVSRTGTGDGCDVRSFARLALDGVPLDPYAARRFAKQRFADWEIGIATSDVALLLVSELVTNAIRYAPGPIVVELQVAGELLRVAVQDRAAQELPRPVGSASHTAENGRGLELVSRLARRWGADIVDDGKEVWFELATA
jgi:hypothetical protein